MDGVLLLCTHYIRGVNLRGRVEDARAVPGRRQAMWAHRKARQANMTNAIWERIKWYLTLAIFLGLFFYAWEIRSDFVSAIVHGQIPGESRFLRDDAAGYHELALKTPFPCFSTKRPPFFLCLGRFWLQTFGELSAGTAQEIEQEKGDLPPDEFNRRLVRVLSNEFALRRLDLVTSQLALSAIFALTLVLAGRFAALFASFLWTLNSWDIRYSSSFLREDLILFFNLVLVLLFILLIRNPAKKSTWIGIALLLIAVGSAAALTHLTFFITILGMVIVYNGVSRFRGAWSGRDIGVSIAVYAGIWLVALPYLLFNHHETHAFFAPLHNDARFWRNHEFAGQPGYPTRQQVMESPYTGEPITPSEYVIGKHSLPEVFGRYLKGYGYAFFRHTPRLFKFVPPFEFLRYAVWLTLPGLIACHFMRREGYFFLLAGLIALFPNAFILPLDVVLSREAPAIGPGVEPRFTLPLLPFTMILCALAVERVRGVLARLLVEAALSPKAKGIGDQDAGNQQREP